MAYEDAWRAYPDVLPCLQELRHQVTVAVLSNGDQSQQEDKLRRTGLLDQFASVLTSDPNRNQSKAPDDMHTIGDLGELLGAIRRAGSR